MEALAYAFQLLETESGIIITDLKQQLHIYSTLQQKGAYGVIFSRNAVHMSDKVRFQPLTKPML